VPHSVHGAFVARLQRQRALPRTAIALAVGVATGLALGVRFWSSLSALAGWAAGGLAMFAMAWMTIWTCDPSATRSRAAAEDPGRTAVYVIVLATSVASLLAVTVMVRFVKGIAPAESRQIIALCLAAVALSWALTHTVFALRYAHLYYREDAEGVGGVEFPGGAAPSYLDFAYFAFTVGMCFQVSDVTVSSPQIRRAVLLHATLSFFYNTAMLAFVLNLLFGIAA